MEIGLIIITILSAILAGMGVGGGAIYIFLSTNFCSVSQKEAQMLNLILFVSVSLGVILFELKKQKIKIDLIKKIVPCLLIGSVLGTKMVEKVSDEKLKIYFSLFLAFLGLYEIISSLKNNKNTKNNNENNSERRNKNV